MSEIELKFSFPPAAAKKVLAVLRRLPGAGKTAAEELDAVYFDTARRALSKNGLALRLRRENGTLIQTLKSAAPAGSLARGEWNDPVTGDTPDLSAGKSGRKLRAVLKKISDKQGDRALVPQFRVTVSRRTVLIRHGETAIEAALDRGEISHGRRKEPICELELELKSGQDISQLYDLALKLTDELPIAIESRSKAERGFALAKTDGAALVRNTRPASVRFSPKIALDGCDCLGAALRAAGRGYLAQVAGNTAAVIANEVEGIHQMRVGLRRLRGILSAAKNTLPLLQYAWARDRLKAMQQTLGTVRNWDVLRARLDDVPDLPHRRTAAHRKLVKAADARKDAAHLRAAHAVVAKTTTVAILELARWFERLGTPDAAQAPALAQDLDRAAKTLLNRQFKKLRKRGRSFAALTPEERHKLRIACKNMRYTAELLAPLYPERPLKRFIKTLKAAQEGLGTLNDVRSAHTLLTQVGRRGGKKRKAGVGKPVGEVLGWLDHDARDTVGKTAKHIEKLCGARTFW